MITALAMAGLLVGCSGESTTEPAEVAAATAALPSALIEKTWQYRLADATVRARFESDPGWGAVFRRDYGKALTSFGDDAGRARIHLEYAALYRQALLMYAHSTHHAYGENREASDPIEVDYLLGISRYFRADESTAAAWEALSPEADADIITRAIVWQEVAAWPPALSAASFPEALPAVTPGDNPQLNSLPHYQLSEQTEQALVVETADPTALYALSRWHEEAAGQLSGNPALISQLLAPHRLPVEPAPTAELTTIDDSWLFLSSGLTCAEDAAFIADASARGLPAVEQWKDSSPLAAAVSGGIEDGAVVPDIMLDQAAQLRQQVLDAMHARSGTTEDFQDAFAWLGRVAVLRAGMVVADANDQYRDAGILRLNALEQLDSMKASLNLTKDPVFVLSVAAWDSGNRNPVRAQQLVHGLLKRFPSLTAARYPLDALNVRASRNAGPSIIAN